MGDAKVGDLTISGNSNNSLQLVDLRQNSQSNSDSGHENDAADQMLTINKKITKSSKNDEDTSEKSSTANSNNNNTTPLPVPQGLRLETPWTLFVDKIPDSGASLEDYQENLRNIYTVQSVETFWQVFNNIPAPSCLSCRYSYHLMRGDGTRQPTWEDPLNANGGHWKLKCHKQYTNLVWQELLLAAVGEQFSTSTRYDDMVTGVSVSIRELEICCLELNFIRFFIRSIRVMVRGLMVGLVRRRGRIGGIVKDPRISETNRTSQTTKFGESRKQRIISISRHFCI